MSQITRDINRVTRVIIGISGKLILYALIVLLLAEGMSRGYAFGHAVFDSQPMEAAPGTDKSVVVTKGESPSDVIRTLGDMGLIGNELAVRVQLAFYDYKIYPGTYTLNTSMTSKEILQILNTDSGTGQEEE